MQLAGSDWPVPAGARYLELAEQAVAAGVAGSSAGGEFPKFTAQRALGDSATADVIVKFSGSEESVPGIVSARTRIVVQGGRTFLDVERFDRHGEAGRSPLCALDILNATFLGDASVAAHAFWLAVAGDGRIGDGFRAIATANAIDLARLQDKA